MTYLLTSSGDELLLTPGSPALASADLLAACKREAQRPTTDEGTDDTEWYQRLSVAQDKWLARFSVHVPQTQVSPPEAVTSSDSGATYTLAYYPLGQVELRHGRAGPVLIPGEDWNESADYVIEGQTIRTPGGRTNTWDSGLYARYVRLGSTVISENDEPVLKPATARILLVYQAVADWAMEGGLRDPSPWLKKMMDYWRGDPHQPDDVGLLGALKMQHFAQGGLTVDPGVYWWRGIGT